MSRVLFCLLLALAVFALGQELTSTAIPLRILVLNSAEEAARVRVELEKGADFAVLARQKSVDATSLDGGLLGKVDPSTLREEIRTAVRGLAPGQISPVFRMPSGFAIVKVLPPDEFAGIAESQRARQAAIRAEGSIRFDVNLSGFSEAAAALANYAKPANWNTDLKLSCTLRQQSFADLKARAKKLAATADGAWPLACRFRGVAARTWRRYMPIREKWIRLSPSSKRLSALPLPGRRSYYPR